MTPAARMADDLRRALESCAGNADLDVTITAKGIHAEVLVTIDKRSVRVHCFDSSGGLWAAQFDLDATTMARGRTGDVASAASSIRLWLEGADLPALHRHFPFVDRQKRALESLCAQVHELVPDLARAPADLRTSFGDIHELCFGDEARSCLVSFYGDEVEPYARFYWDGSEMFEFRVRDIAHMAPILHRWIVKHEQPSTLRDDFPWLQLRPPGALLRSR